MKRGILDLIERAAWTFAQSFYAYTVLAGGQGLTLKAVEAGAIAAGMSALKTLGVNLPTF